ncbi:MAG: 2-phospho-L-lactate guanylyltransferase [Acidobacteria bacterium]|nr:2-phospho-L-lactate guanylyltransferase [Acidobacteriota bacterium]
MILVPVKDFSTAKQRLAQTLTPEQRRELARTMFQDVLRALGAVAPLTAIGIVTRDPEALRLADEAGFGRIYDGLNAGETEAIEMATQHAIARGAEFTLVIPGDAPLVAASEISLILEAGRRAGTVLAPAADGQGTNAVFRRPAGLFPLRFGNHSFVPHLRAAIATQKPVVVFKRPGIALDVDRVADLHALAQAAGSGASQQLVRRWGFGAAAVARAAGF